MQIPPFRLERFLARHEFSAPYLLGSSDCESMTMGELLALEPGAESALLELRLGYTESPGAPELRRAIGSLYADPDPSRVLVFTGAEEAIFAFASALLSPGDHVVAPSPCYQSLQEVARAKGCEVTSWEAREDDGAWSFDLDDLERCLRPDTRAVIVNFPHNPTGAIVTSKEMKRIGDLCARSGAWLFSDEVYRGLEYDGADPLPAACDTYDRAISLGVMSKSMGLPGLRIGWIATSDRKAYDAMAAFKDYTTICNSAPSERLAALALRQRNIILRRNRELVAANLARLDGFFARHPQTFAWTPPHAGCIAFPRLHHPPATRFCEDLIAQAGVLLVPSAVFGLAADAHFRIGFGRATFDASLDRLETFLLRGRA